MNEIELIKQFILDAPAPHRKHIEAIEWVNNLIRGYEAKIAGLEKSIEEKQKSK